MSGGGAVISRRSILAGLVALAVPAIIRTPGLLMPVKVLETTPQFTKVVYRFIAHFSSGDIVNEIPMPPEFVAALNAGMKRGEILSDWLDTVPYQVGDVVGVSSIGPER